MYTLARAFATGLLWVVLAPRWVGATEWRINEAGFKIDQPPHLVVAGERDVGIGYADDAGRFIVRRPDGQAVVLGGGPTASGFTLGAAGDRLYAAWREKREKSFVLLFRTSADKGATWDEAVVLDCVTRPLTRIVVQGDPQGRVHVAWLGERAGDDKAVVDAADTPPSDSGRQRHYHIYARYSADAGKSWGETHRLTTGYTESIWPTLLSRDGNGYSVSWSQRDGKRHVIFTRTDEGGRWRAPSVVQEVGDVLILKPVWVGSRLLVLWLGKHPRRGYALEGAFTDDEKTWTPITLEDTRGLDIATLAVAVQRQNVYLAFSARLPAVPAKQTVHFARSSDGGKTWDKLKTLRHYPFTDTTALYPRLALGDGDTVVVAWNDFRAIRGALYLNYSTNGGGDWLSEDRPIGAPGARNEVLHPLAGGFARVDKDYFLLAARYRQDDFGGPADLVLRRFTLADLTKPTDPSADVDATARQALLKSSATRLWQALVDGDYKSAYGLFDPYFRAHFREIDYLAATGRIDYQSFQLKDIVVNGNVGRARIEYAYTIPEFATKQGKFSRPMTRADVTETWLFIGDQWLKEYRNESGDFTYTRY